MSDSERLIGKINKLRGPTKQQKKQVAAMIRSANWGALGSVFWQVFLTRKKNDPVRRAYSKMWKALPEWAKDLCDS